MAFNNYSGRTGGEYPSQSGGSRQDGFQNNRSEYRTPPVEIRAEEIPEDFVDRAEKVMRELSQERKNVSTSKIRNLLSLITEVYNTETLRTAEKLTSESISKLQMMRVRVAYECGRDNATKTDTPTKTFVEKARIMQYLKGIGSKREAAIRMAHYMEALVAYHRYFGGKEN